MFTLQRTRSPAGGQHPPTAVRAWRMAAELTASDVDDGSQVEALLDQVATPLASFIADGAYNLAGIYGIISKHHPEADVIIPPRSTAVLSDDVQTTPTQRDRHLQSIAAWVGRRHPGIINEPWWRAPSAG